MLIMNPKLKKKLVRKVKSAQLRGLLLRLFGKRILWNYLLTICGFVRLFLRL